MRGAAFAALAAGGFAVSAASAAKIGFSGTQSYTNVLNTPGTGRCAPNTTVDIAPGSL